VIELRDGHDAVSPTLESASEAARGQTAAADREPTDEMSRYPQTMHTDAAQPPASRLTPLAGAAILWPLWIATLLALGGAAAGLATGVSRLHANWLDMYSYSHGYLVLAMSVWLFVIALRDRPVSRLAPSISGVLVLAAALAVYVLAEIVDIAIGVQAMLPVLLLATIAALCGLPLARVAFIPIAFLYFAIPLWNLLTVPLQDVTTLTVTSALRLSNITAFIEGYSVATPAGTFEIAQGCSGLHFFVVGLALAAFYGLNWYRRWSTRLLLLTVAGAVSMLANWVRVYVLIVVGDMTDMRHYLIVEDHYLFGWVLYGVMMAPVLWLARRLELGEAASARELAGTPVRGENWENWTLTIAPAAAFVVVGAVAGVLLSSPALLRAGPDAPAEPASIASAAELAPQWRPVPPAAAWRPNFNHPHAVLHEGYTGPVDVQVDVYLARYLSQSPRAKLIYHRNTLDRGWQSVAATSRGAPLNGGTRTVREIELSAGGERRLVWFWYRVGGSPTHDRTHAKLLELPALARGRRDGAVIALSASCTVLCESARVAMAEFLSTAGAGLEAAADGRWDEAP
jgi:EpsI family protein